jgi:hypothetical protein
MQSQDAEPGYRARIQNQDIELGYVELGYRTNIVQIEENN